MNSFDSPQPQRQDSLKRRWQEIRKNVGGAPPASSGLLLGNPKDINLLGFPELDDDDLVSTVVPPVTIVLEGRSICQRISLHKHGSYHSLAKALRQMFVEGADASQNDDVDLSNAIPGHLIAYEDIENDLLLASDLKWKDFVRVAKRIRILPVKSNTRKGRGGI